LVENDYWNRAWILQELAVNRNLEIIWQQQTLDLKEIVDTLDTTFPYASFDHIKQILRLRQSQLRDQHLRLVEVLHISSHASATDPLDKVYSVLGLSTDGKYIVPSPSYSETPEALSRSITIGVIERTQSLDIIVFRNITNRWFPDWFEGKYWSDPRMIFRLTTPALRGADYRVEEHGYMPEEPFSAGREQIVPPEFDSESITVQGIIIDSIEACCYTLDESLNWHSYLPRAKDYKDFIKFTELLDGSADERSLRYLLFELQVGLDDPECSASRNMQSPASSSEISVEDFFAPFKDPDENYVLALAQDLNSQLSVPIDLNQVLEIRKWLQFDSSGSPSTTPPQNQTTMEERLSQEVMGYVSVNGPRVARLGRNLAAGMRLGKTSQGREGWFCRGARPGDLIAIVPGCSVPTILRRREGAEGYKLVGDGIIYKLMYGEALSPNHIGDVNFKDIKIY
jgi:hypothetical protein